jgi:hypothetical protein
MSDEKKSFTVTDRRHFTAEGEVRDGEPDAVPAPPDAPSAAQTPDGAPEPRAGDDFAPPAARRGRAERFDFSALLLSLGTQAGLLLGDLAVPGEEPLPPDLEGARDVIDLLEELATKTQGRRTPEEDRVLEALLYDLRLRYVKRMGGR